MEKWILVSVLFCSSILHAQQEPLDVFDAYQGSESTWIQYQGVKNSWYNHIHGLADQYLDRRQTEVRNCRDEQSWEERKIRLKKILEKSVGGLPGKTPIQARTIAILERPSFWVEKIIYESLPGFYVTACLFLPKNQKTPAPAIIYCSGHAAEAFRSPVYQRVIINLVEKGFIVLAFDPIGQGERYQYLNDKGEPDIGGPTKEHSYAGLQCLIQGKSIARYMIYDGIRAVDYLLSRPEVDRNRIGITGRSGGGTQSAYIAAFDDRIYAVAPENYITSYRRIWASIGPQDAEQTLLNAHLLGIDHGDLLSVRAPKPAMMLTTTRDYFSIQGARETFREVELAYRAYNAENQFVFSEDDYQHGSTVKNREAMFTFFQRVLKLPGDPSDREVQLFTTKELTIAPTGQVVTSFNSRTVFDLIQEEALQLTEPLEIQQAKMKIREITGVQSPQRYQTVVFTGRIIRDGYSIEKYFLEFANGRYPVPFVLASPSSQTTTSYPTILYLNSKGKKNAMQVGGEIEQLVRAGYSVLAPDLLNQGELGPDPFGGDAQFGNISFNLVQGSNLVGKSLIAFQTEDLMVLMTYIKEELNIDPHSIVAIADDIYCISLMHYTLLESSFSKICLRRLSASWREIISTERYLPEFAYTIVPAALPDYDWTDIFSISTPRKLKLMGWRNAAGGALTNEEYKAFYIQLNDRYRALGEQYSLSMTKEEDWMDILNWLKE